MHNRAVSVRATFSQNQRLQLTPHLQPMLTSVFSRVAQTDTAESTKYASDLSRGGCTCACSWLCFAWLGIRDSWAIDASVQAKIWPRKHRSFPSRECRAKLLNLKSSSGHCNSGPQ